MNLRAICLALALSIAAPTPPSLAQSSDAQIYRTVAPMQTTVEQRIRPHIEALYERLFRERRAMQIGGAPAFHERDVFLPGKIALVWAELITSGDPAAARAGAARFRELAELNRNDEVQSWGIYYYLLALNLLDRAHLLDEALSPELLAELRAKLDWRTFVNPETHDLNGAANNYLGVALAIARLRHALGWEDTSASEAIFARIVRHYEESGSSGLQDETGDGRFDRYSMLLSAEIAQHFIETGAEPPAIVKTWLRRSVDVALPRLNLRGEGFEYGRSLGAYGDTALVEVLTVAARAGVLTPEERDLAYAFASRAAARFADFWIDPEMGSINLWRNGRRTDSYRGEHRIFGENLSLAHQYFYTSALWRELGATSPSPGYEAALERLPRTTITWFEREGAQRFLLTRRDRGRTLGLPFISGGPTQHANTAYFPIPFSADLIAGAAGRGFPQLLPQITLDDGARLAPLVYFDAADVSADAVTVRQAALDRLGARDPEPDDRLSVVTRYAFAEGRIERTDTFTPRAPLNIRAIELSFASFSATSQPRLNGADFANGAAASFTVEGLDGCTTRRVRPTQRTYQTPTGPYRTLVACAAGPRTVDVPFTIRWTLTYR